MIANMVGQAADEGVAASGSVERFRRIAAMDEPARRAALQGSSKRSSAARSSVAKSRRPA